MSMWQWWKDQMKVKVFYGALRNAWWMLGIRSQRTMREPLVNGRVGREGGYWLCKWKRNNHLQITSFKVTSMSFQKTTFYNICSLYNDFHSQPEIFRKIIEEVQTSGTSAGMQDWSQANEINSPNYEYFKPQLSEFKVEKVEKLYKVCVIIWLECFLWVSFKNHTSAFISVVLLLMEQVCPLLI